MCSRTATATKPIDPACSARWLMEKTRVIAAVLLASPGPSHAIEQTGCRCTLLSLICLCNSARRSKDNDNLCRRAFTNQHENGTARHHGMPWCKYLSLACRPLDVSLSVFPTLFHIFFKIEVLFWNEYEGVRLVE
jgi:hypothetical protein